MSAMRQGISKPRGLKSWWAYFWLNLFLIVFSQFLPAQSLFQYSIDAFWAIGLVPLYGYLKQVPIVSATLWQIYFLVSAIAFVGQFVWAFISAGAEVVQEFGVTLVVIAATLLLGSPMFWANVAYAFRSPHLWSSSTLHG